MRVCLMIEGQAHYTAIIRPDADAHDAWATLAGLAAVTGRIRI